jgi:hypothetical protein
MWKSVLYVPNTAALGLLYYSTFVYFCVKRFVPLIKSNSLFTIPPGNLSPGFMSPRRLNCQWAKIVIVVCYHVYTKSYWHWNLNVRVNLARHSAVCTEKWFWVGLAAWYQVPDSHCMPVKPGRQIHISGLTQDPPFRHSRVHKAVTNQNMSHLITQHVWNSGFT